MSAEELFPAEAVTMDSPRLAWMKRHRVQTAHSDHPVDPDESDDCWVAWIERVEGERLGPKNAATGETEQEALWRIAIKFSLPLWNEEEAAGRVS